MTRSGHSSHGLARTVNQAPNTIAPTASARDSSVISRPANINESAAIASVSEAARPKVPTRNHWSATTPMSKVQPSTSQVAANRTSTLSHPGSGRVTVAGDAGCQAAPSQRHRPSGES